MSLPADSGTVQLVNPDAWWWMNLTTPAAKIPARPIRSSAWTRGCAWPGA